MITKLQNLRTKLLKKINKTLCMCGERDSDLYTAMNIYLYSHMKNSNILEWSFQRVNSLLFLPISTWSYS